MDNDLRELMKLCYQSAATLTLISGQLTEALKKIDGMGKRIDKLESERVMPNDSAARLKMWHVGLLTVVWALASNIPTERLLDLIK